MKNIWSLVFLISLLSACKPSAEDAINYNDQMISEQAKVATVLDSLNQLIKNKDTLNITSFYNKTLEEVKKSIDSIQKTTDFNKEPDYKNQMLKLLKTYQSLTENEYHQVIDICLISDSSLTKDTLAFLNKTLLQINDKISVQMKEFTHFQQDFAKKYEFSLVDSK